MKRVADCLYGVGDYAEALRVYQDVDTRSLSGDAAAEMCYRRGFCAMKEAAGRNQAKKNLFGQAGRERPGNRRQPQTRVRASNRRERRHC